MFINNIYLKCLNRHKCDNNVRNINKYEDESTQTR